MALHPADYEEKLDLYKEKIERDVFRWRKDNIDSDLENMADGGDGGTVGGGRTIRDKFFEGWHDEDFTDLLTALKRNEQTALLEKLEDEVEGLVSRAKGYNIDSRVFRDMVLRTLG